VGNCTEPRVAFGGTQVYEGNPFPVEMHEHGGVLKSSNTRDNRVFPVLTVIVEAVKAVVDEAVRGIPAAIGIFTI
jgi:hypothetical protein